jgi:hypothetical protein
MIERLGRFTPDAGGLDRDALLFAAGQASARPNRGWMALALALVMTQVATLVLMWPRPAPTAPAPLAQPPALQQPAPPVATDAPGLWSMHRRLLESEGEEPAAPPSAEPLIETSAPLRAFNPPSSILY